MTRIQHREEALPGGAVGDVEGLVPRGFSGSLWESFGDQLFVP